MRAQGREPGGLRKEIGFSRTFGFCRFSNQDAVFLSCFRGNCTVFGAAEGCPRGRAMSWWDRARLMGGKTESGKGLPCKRFCFSMHRKQEIIRKGLPFREVKPTISFGLFRGLKAPAPSLRTTSLECSAQEDVDTQTLLLSHVSKARHGALRFVLGESFAENKSRPFAALSP